MEGSLHSLSILDSFQHKQNEKLHLKLSQQVTIRLTLPKLDAEEFIMFKISYLESFHSEIPRYTFYITQNCTCEIMGCPVVPSPKIGNRRLINKNIKFL